MQNLTESMKVRIGSLILLFFLLMQAAAADAKVFLVSAGISDYPGTADDLPQPVKDVQYITDLYRSNCEVVYCQLLDREATRSKILAAIRKVTAGAGADDIVVFFYSGHGCPDGLCVYDGLLTYGNIRNAMSVSKCKNKMIFANACFSGNMRSTRGRGNGQNSVTEAKKSNVMLFLSSRSHEYSWGRTDMEHTYFTTYLHKGLSGQADKNRDRIITARELYDYVHQKVVEISGNEQHPVMWGSFSDNMPVMVWKKR